MVPRVNRSRDRLVAVGMRLLRGRGYDGTTVEDICRAARVTKGAFFHSFPTKEALALAALEAYLGEIRARYLANTFASDPDPRARVRGYLALTIEIAESPLLRDGCLLGLLSREDTTPKLAARCRAAFAWWAASIGELTGLAAEDATYLLSVLEGALIVAHAAGDPELVRTALLRCADELAARA